VRTIVLVLENTVATDLTVGRSAVRRRILALLMAEPDQRLHLREIQRRVRTSPGTASRELARLVAAGLAERQAEGHQVYFRATSSPFATMVRSLLIVPSAAETEPAPTPPGPVGTAPESIRPPRTIRPAGPAQKGPPRPDALGLEVAGRLAGVLRPLYGDRLAGLYLHGARARGEAGPDAEVEVVVVLNTIARYGDELERTSSACAGLSLEFGLIVSRLFVAGSSWESRTDGHFLAIRSEAGPL
jgi:predicted transcriptional regulator with HTH domain